MLKGHDGNGFAPRPIANTLAVLRQLSAHDIKRKRILLLVAAAVIVAALVVVYLLGTVLLPLGLSLVIAYVLLPLARLLERGMPWRDKRPGVSRGIAIGAIFLFLLGVLAGFLALVIPPTVEQGTKFANEFPGFINSARVTVENWIDLYAELIPVRSARQSGRYSVRCERNHRRSGVERHLSDARGRLRFLRLDSWAGNVAGAGLLPDEGLLKDTGVPVCTLPGCPEAVSSERDRHRGPNRRWLHSRPTYLGADGWRRGNRWFAAAWCALPLRAGPSRPESPSSCQ